MKITFISNTLENKIGRRPSVEIMMFLCYAGIIWEVYDQCKDEVEAVAIYHTNSLLPERHIYF